MNMKKNKNKIYLLLDINKLIEDGITINLTKIDLYILNLSLYHAANKQGYKCIYMDGIVRQEMCDKYNITAADISKHLKKLVNNSILIPITKIIYILNPIYVRTSNDIKSDYYLQYMKSNNTISLTYDDIILN